MKPMREVAHSVSIGMRLVVGEGITLRRVEGYAHGDRDLLEGMMSD